MGKTLVLEYKTYKFETKIKSMTFPHYLYSQNQFKKYGILLLNQAWPIEAIRLMGLRLSNMRDKRKDKGVKVCPELTETDIPQAPNGTEDKDGDEAADDKDKEEDKIEFTDTHAEKDDEGVEDPEIEQKHDEENM